MAGISAGMKHCRKTLCGALLKSVEMPVGEDLDKRLQQEAYGRFERRSRYPYHPDDLYRCPECGKLQYRGR